MITLLTKEMITKEIEQDAHRLFSMLSRRYQRALSELFEDKNTAPYVAGYIEDGIRDYEVTGVQTCALPISKSSPLET